MLPMNDYRDVFLPTAAAYEVANMWAWILGGGLILAVALVFWVVGGVPGVPSSLTTKQLRKVMATIYIALFGSLIVATVALVFAIVSYFDYESKVAQVEENMKYNVMAKYDAELKGWGRFANQPAMLKELDQPRTHTLIFGSEDGPERGEKAYRLRFDRATSEPFVTERNAQPTPTAEELEKSAKK